jgi:hypothetical protein
MEKIIEYNLATAASAPDLQKAVNSNLKDGWELFGSPFSHQGYVCQAMIKNDRSEAKSGDVPSTLKTSNY